MKPRILALILTAVLAAATLTGCSSNPEENTTSDTASTTSSMLESDALVTPAEDEVASGETVTNEDGSTTTTETLEDGSVVTTTTAADGTQTVTTAPPTTSTGSASSSGGITATTSRPAATTGTPPATTSRPAAPSTPSTPTTSAPTTSSTPSTPSTPSQPEEPVRERTINPQFICDQVNARMTEVGMIDAVTEGVNAGLTPQQSLDEIHTYMGWTEGRENLYAKSDSQVITEMLEMLQNMYNTNQCGPSAWVEVDCYLDMSYHKVANIDDAEYVNFIIYC